YAGLRERWLPLVRTGKIFGNATNELNGRPVGGAEYETSITADGSNFRVTGTKYYCTGSIYADFIGVHVVDGDGQLVRAMVPVSRDGIEVIDDWDGIGQIHSGSGTVRFDHVLVYPEEILPAPVQQSGPQRVTGLAFAQLYLQAIMAGILLAVEDDAVALVRNRTRGFSHAPSVIPGDDPLLQETVGEISSAAFIARAAVLVAAEALDDAVNAATAGHPDAALVHRASLAAARVKVHVDVLATDTATRLFDVGGASATRRGLDLDRHWRNVRTLQGHNPRSYKARAIGDHLINDVDLPANAFF
ncbi:MAG: acyl-CoA dehydrogenase family protein, partial [Gordonia sp. (in: high G+C Gram-positive bacteria)]